MTNNEEQDVIINSILDEGINNIMLSINKPHYSKKGNVTYSYDFYSIKPYSYSSKVTINQNEYQKQPMTNISQTIPYTKLIHPDSSRDLYPKTDNSSINQMKKNLINLQTKICGLEENKESSKKKPIINKSFKKTNTVKSLNKRKESSNKSLNTISNKPRSISKPKRPQLRMNTISSTSNSNIVFKTKNIIINSNTPSNQMRRNQSLNGTIVKKKKELSANETWKEKYEELIEELDQVKTLLDKEKKENDDMKNKIKRSKKKESQMNQLTKYNEEFVQSKENLIQKYYQSEQIRKEQIKLIQELQNQVNQMRFALNHKSPSL